MQHRTKRIFASILFLDIVGFTDFSEKNDPEIVDDFLTFFFNFCSKEIKKNNGWVEKYIGDAICSIFYSSISSAKDALNACNCAYNILKNAKSFKQQNKFPFSIRIGIDCGIVTTTKRDQYDVFVGQAINSASRIQSVTKPDHCYVSSHIFDKAKNIFIFNDIGDFELKGISDKIKLFSLEDKKDIYTIERVDNFYFQRKEEIEAIKLISDNCKIKLVINGVQGSGKTYFIYKIAEHIKNLYNTDAIYLPINDWEKSTDEIILKINSAIEYKNIQKNFNNNVKSIIIDNFNNIDSKNEVLKYIEFLNFIDSIIISYTYEDEKNDTIKLLLESLNYKFIKIDKLTYEDFSSYVFSFFSKPVPAYFESKLYNLCDGYIGRAYNFLSVLKDEFKLNYNQIIDMEFDELFSKNQDLLEHCYRINGIDEKMQILLSIIAFSNKPINDYQLQMICERLGYIDYPDFVELAYKKGWLLSNDSYYKISNEYLKQFIINSTSNQLKNRIIEILLDFSEKTIDKIIYLFSIYEERQDIIIDENSFFSQCFSELENTPIEEKLILLKKLVKKLNIPFFGKIVKFLLLDTKIYPYLLNVLKKEEILFCVNSFPDIKQIKELNLIQDIYFTESVYFQKERFEFNQNKNIQFYTDLINYLIYPKLFLNNQESYKTLNVSMRENYLPRIDYIYLFNFPFINIEVKYYMEKLIKLFENESVYKSKIEEIYLNPSFIYYNKLQIFFILIENISLFIYFKKKPINQIYSMLSLCEKIALEMNSPILTEYYYGLFFYIQFVLSNFQFYGIHSKMEFKIIPQLKELNEVIYFLFSYSFENKEEILKENEFLANCLKKAKELLLNPPYFIPLSISHWYYYLIYNQFDDEIIKIKEKIKLIKTDYYYEKRTNRISNQMIDFVKIIFSFC